MHLLDTTMLVWQQESSDLKARHFWPCTAFQFSVSSICLHFDWARRLTKKIKWQWVNWQQQSIFYISKINSFQCSRNDFNRIQLHVYELLFHSPCYFEESVLLRIWPVSFFWAPATSVELGRYFQSWKHWILNNYSTYSDSYKPDLIVKVLKKKKSWY